MVFALIFDTIGGTEWLVLLGVVLIVVGPKNLPATARKIGKIMAQIRRAADEFKRQLMTMDQEVTRAVNDMVDPERELAESQSKVVSLAGEGSDSGGNEQSGGGEDSAYDSYSSYNPESPYPGHGEYYDGTYVDASSEPAAEPSADEPAKPAHAAHSAVAESEDGSKYEIKISVSKPADDNGGAK